MEAIAALLGIVGMISVLLAAFFMLCVQPIWSICDIACSPRIPTGGKVTLIILTLVLLGPLLTFFYALFGSRSRGLRKSTLVGAACGVVALAVLFTGAALAPPGHDMQLNPGGVAEFDGETADPDFAALVD